MTLPDVNNTPPLRERPCGICRDPLQDEEDVICRNCTPELECCMCGELVEKGKIKTSWFNGHVEHYCLACWNDEMGEEDMEKCERCGSQEHKDTLYPGHDTGLCDPCAHDMGAAK